MVGNALVLDALVGSFHTLWLGILLLLQMAAVGAALLRWSYLRPVARWHSSEILGMLVVCGVFVAHAVHLAPADLMPVSSTVDCPHQHLLVNYIYTHHSFPDDIDYLYIYNDYPVGPSALAALLARLLGVLPAQTMYPLAVMLVAAQVMVVYGTAVELLPSRPSSYVVASLSVLMTLLPYKYSIEVFAERFYSNMMMGDLIVMAALWTTVVWKRLHPTLAIGLTICLAFACLNSYPAWTPFVATPLFASLLLDKRIPARKRWQLTGVLLAVTLALTIIAAVDQWGFITWFGPSRDRTSAPTWNSLHLAFIVLAGWGTWVVIRDWRQQVHLVLFLALDAAFVGGLYVISAMDYLSQYIPDKTFYFNVFLFSVVIAIGLNRIRERLPQAAQIRHSDRTAVAAVVAIAVVAAVTVNTRFLPPTEYPITLDEYKIAYHLSRQAPDTDLTYLVRNSATFYWIYGCVLNHTHDVVNRTEQWEASRPTYEAWIQDQPHPQQAIVSELAELPEDGRWRVVIQSGDSGVIERVQNHW